MPISSEVRSKIALFCNVQERAVIEARDVASIYHVPLHLHGDGLDGIIIKLLHMDVREPDISGWETMVSRMNAIDNDVPIAVVGKYVQIRDAYKSIIEAFTQAGISNDVDVEITWIDAEDIEKLEAE